MRRPHGRPRPRRRAAVPAVVVVGAAAAVGLALALEMTVTDGLGLAVTAGAGALGAGAAGSLVLRGLRRRALGAQVVAVALTAVGAVVAGSMAAARAMFLSPHDLDALAVVVVAAATVAVAIALGLGRRVARAGRDLAALTRDLARGEVPAVTGEARPGELEALAGELAATSRRLAEARRHEQALESSRRELVAWVSHDLRTPLAGIRAIVEALEDRVVTDEATVARYHHTLRREADRLAQLVDDLFELSRIESGSLALQFERASLADLVSDAVAASTPAAQAKGVHLEGRVRGPAPELDLSSAEVARVLRNLLENAIRHTPSDASVVVDVGVEGSSAVVSVADGCGGIPPADLERVFDAAYRGEASRTPTASPGGAGLGLAIVRGIVEAHRGDVAVTNHGPGCRFVVRLPLAPAGL